MKTGLPRHLTVIDWPIYESGFSARVAVTTICSPSSASAGVGAMAAAVSSKQVEKRINSLFQQLKRGRARMVCWLFSARSPTLSSREEIPRSPGTPRPRDGSTASGRSPGSRVITRASPSRINSSGMRDANSPVTVAGAAPDGGPLRPLPGSLFIPSLGTCRDAPHKGARRQGQA